MRVKRKQVIAAILGSIVVQGGAYGATATTTASSDYELNPVVVTATRSEKQDLNVPASTTVLSTKDLQNTGAQNLQVALGRVPGLDYETFGAGGAAMGTMTNDVIIRGVDNGTLVMVNGSPINLRGKYYLDAIPVDSIEKVEVIKGGSSVLYGSEAMGGVINIITKKQYDNAITVGYGNYGQQKYTLTTGNDKINIAYNLEKWGTVSDISSETNPDKHSDMNKSIKSNAVINYNINKNLTLNYNHYETDVRYTNWFDNAYANVPAGGAMQNYRQYVTKEDLVQLNYDGKDNGWKVNTYLNHNHLSADGPTYFTTTGKKSPGWYSTDEVNQVFGTDVQKKWNVSENTSFILGGNYQHESYDNYKGIDASRNIYALFGQYDQNLTDKDEIILGARHTWTTGAFKDQNYQNTSLSGQYLHNINNNDSLYVNVSQSFIMPTFAQMYGVTDRGIPNPDLKPQKGITYEAGWKRITDNYSLKAAVYHMYITDNITATYLSGTKTYQYHNEDFKNTGVEVSGTVKGTKGFTYNWGVSYNNPLSKETGYKATKNYWDRKYGRLQLTGGVAYDHEKWSGSLQGTFLGMRVEDPSSAHSYDVKPYFLTSLVVAYRPNKQDTVSLTVDNLLDRRDNLSHSGYDYYSTPINYLLSYKHTF